MNRPVIAPITFLCTCALVMGAFLPGHAQPVSFNGNKSNRTDGAEVRSLSFRQQAQQALGRFVASFRSNSADAAYTFFTLVYFPETAERAWIVVKSIDGKDYTGYLGDSYENSANRAAEPLLRFGQHQVEDWRIEDLANENTTGNFALNAQLEGALRDRQRVRLREEWVPVALRGLIPLARFWGIPDDLVRGQQRKKASPQQRDALRRQVQGKEKMIEQWLGGYTSRFNHSAEEESFYYLLIASKETGDNAE
jgi:hypothetical protein